MRRYFNFNINPDQIKKSGRLITLIFIIAIVIIIGYSSVYFVSEGEVAVKLTLGKATSVESAGMYFRIPLIQDMKIMNIKTQGMQIGYVAEIREDTTSQLISSEPMQIITSDLNIVELDLYAEWQIMDPLKNFQEISNPEELVYRTIESSTREVISSYDIDDVITAGKTEIELKIEERTNDLLDEYDSGMIVHNVIIQDADPPTAEIISAFRNVEDAKQRRETALNEAQKYYNEEIPKARSEADEILNKAEAYKEGKILEAEGEVARFNELYSEYRLNPEIVGKQEYLQRLSKILPNYKLIIDSSNTDTLKILDLDK